MTAGRWAGRRWAGRRWARERPYASHVWPSARQNSPSRPARRDQPVQNSPCRPARRDQPVQNSPGTPQNADFGPVFARRENFLPLSPPTTRAGRTLSRMRGRFRYKTLPARPKTLISTHFSRAGRTFYRFRHQQPEQGELFTASATNNPSRENFIPHAEPLPVQNSPSKRPWQAHPVQNSPSEPQNADFGPPFACRENFVPLPPPTRRARRKKSRTNTPPQPSNVPLSKFRTQFDCMNFQQSSETLQFQRHKFTL